MRRLGRWLLPAVAAIALLVIAALAAAPYLVDTPRVQSLIAHAATQALGRPVRFAALSVKVLPRPAVELRGLEVAEDPAFGPTPFLRLERGELRLRVRPLLAGRVEFGDLVLRQPVIRLVEGADGRWNIGTLGAGREAAPPARGGRGGGAGTGGAVLAARVRIENGLLTYQPREGGARAPYRVENLDLTIVGGQPLTFTGDARVMPGALGVKITDGALATNGARAVADASVRAKVRVEARNVKDLGGAAGVPAIAGGALRGELAVGGTVGHPRASGTVEVRDLVLAQVNPRCAEPKRRTLTIPAVSLRAGWEDSRLTARPFTASLAKGTVTSNVVVHLSRDVRVEMRDLAIAALPLERVLVDFLCQGYAVTGPLDVAGSLGFAAGDPWGSLSGAGRLRIGAGKVVGPEALALIGTVVHLGSAVSSLLAADVPVALFSSPLDFDSITGSYRIANGVVTTRDLVYASRAMKVSVAGEYALPTGRMNLDLVVNHGRGRVAAKVTGTAASPSVRLSPTALLRDLDPGRIERGLQDLLKRFR